MISKLGKTKRGLSRINNSLRLYLRSQEVVENVIDDLYLRNQEVVENVIDDASGHPTSLHYCILEAEARKHRY